VLILGILVGGMLVGAIAQLVLGRSGSRVDWGMALIAGLAGSFVGGLLFSLLAGDGLALKPSGLIGSIVGAIIVTAIWQWVVAKQKPTQKAAQTAAQKQAAKRPAAKSSTKRRR
jgi:uncharacterized membrane protein YeaQ/YmgE (transglycosylase-associated protein family)